MTAPVTIDRAMTLKTTHYEVPLVLGIEGDPAISTVGDFTRLYLYWGLPEGSETSAWVHVDQSRRAVRQALREAIRVARDIDAVNGRDAPLSEHEAIFERIRVFASKHGTLWGDAVPDPMPRGMDDRRIEGSMCAWFGELLTLLDVYELVAVAAGRREDRSLHHRVVYVKNDKVAVFVSRTGEPFMLAPRGREIVIQAPWERKPQSVSPWQLVRGDSSTLAWVILTSICKHRLDGHIAIGLHPSERNSLAITPSGIGPTLYARLWLDALNQEADLDMVRLCQLPGCENPIPDGARADAQYCGDTCRKANGRRLQRLERAAV